jgi:hypothetical protein
MGSLTKKETYPSLDESPIPRHDIPIKGGEAASANTTRVERSGWLACFGGMDTGRRFGTAYTGDEEGDE